MRPSPARRGRTLSPLAVCKRGFYFVVVGCVLASLYPTTGCTSSTLPLAEPVNVCQCRADEMCVQERCVPLGQTLLADVVSGDADAAPVQVCDPNAAGNALISELRHGTSSAQSPDFIEISATSNANLGGWRLQGFDSEGQRTIDITLSGTTDAQGLWLAAWGPLEGGSASLSVGGLGLPSPLGRVLLLDCEGLVHDEVVYGLWPSDTGLTPAAPTRPDESLGRCPGDGSSGDASRDFVVTSAPTPGAPNTSISDAPACVLCETWGGSGSDVWMSEVGVGDAAGNLGFLEVRLSPATAPASAVALEQWVEGAWRTLYRGLPGTPDAEGRLLIEGQQEGSLQLPPEGAALRLVGCRRQPLDAVGYGPPSVEAGLTASQILDTTAGSAFSRCPDAAPPQPLAWSAQTPSPAATNTCP